MPCSGVKPRKPLKPAPGSPTLTTVTLTPSPLWPLQPPLQQGGLCFGPTESAARVAVDRRTPPRARPITAPSASTCPGRTDFVSRLGPKSRFHLSFPNKVRSASSRRRQSTFCSIHLIHLIQAPTTPRLSVASTVPPVPLRCPFLARARVLACFPDPRPLHAVFAASSPKHVLSER